MLPIKRPGRTLVAAAATALLLATAPAAMGATGTLRGSINPDKGPVGSPINLKIGFTVAPDPGRERPIISNVDLYFPPNARTNGAKFPSCSPEVINARKSFAGCPKGSKIGTGLAKADVPATDVFNVPARLTMFNGPGGRSVTIHVDAQNPVVISLAYKAPLIKTKGRYGYHLLVAAADGAAGDRRRLVRRGLLVQRLGRRDVQRHTVHSVDDALPEEPVGAGGHQIRLQQLPRQPHRRPDVG